MLRLKTFGGCVLLDASGPRLDLSAQRRRLALLAAVASAGPAGISRERLQALLWPESDEERARASLNQLLYALRRDVGGSVLTGTAVLALDPSSLSADVYEFEQATSAGDAAVAFARYDGLFLDGFGLPEVVEFEQWTDAKRARYRRQALDAGVRLAREAQAAGQTAEAVRRWQQLTELEPLDTALAIGLMDALVLAGDPARALTLAREFAASWAREFGTPPDRALAAAEARIRALPAAPAAGWSAAAAAVAPADADLLAPAGTRRDTPDAVSAPLPDRPAVPAPSDALGSRASWRRAVAVAVIAVVALASGLLAVRPSRRAVEPPRQWIVLGELADLTGDGQLREVLRLLVASSIDQRRGVGMVSATRIREALRRMEQPETLTVLPERVALELAIREGADAVLLGEVGRVGTRYAVGYRLLRPSDGSVLRAASRTASDDDALVAAVGEALDEVLAPLGELAERRQRRSLPLATTRSLEALRRFAQGSAAFNAGAYADAGRLYAEAVAIDSGFALAHAALGQLHYFLNDAPRGEAAFARALSDLGRLSPRERVLVQAQAASWRGDRAQSAAILRGWLADVPDDFDLWEQLGYDLMRDGKDSLALEAYRAAAALGPLSATSFVNIALAWRGVGRSDSAIAAYRAAFRLDPAVELSNNVNEEYARLLVETGQLVEARQVIVRKAALDGSDRVRALRSLAWLDAFEGDYAAAEARLREGLPLAAAHASALTVARDRVILAGLLTQRGLEAAARQQLREAAQLARQQPFDPIVLYWIGRGLRRLGDREHAWLLDSLNARQRDGNAQHVAAALALEAELAIAAREPARAVELAQQAAALGRSRLFRETLAFALLEAERLDEAVVAFETVGADVAFGTEEQLAWTDAGYWVGRVQELRQDMPAARAAYQAFLVRWGSTAPSLWHAEEAQRRLAVLGALGEEGGKRSQR